MLRKSSFFVLFALVALMCSCISNKQLIAFRTVTPESAEEINKTMKPQPEPRVKINDALIITVTALDPAPGLFHLMKKRPETSPLP